MALSIVYVLTNPAVPGLVKIGYTIQEDANARIGQLYTTGVPVPFKLEFACKGSQPGRGGESVASCLCAKQS